MTIDLETWRVKNRITLAQLAAHLGCSLSQARRYCIGEKMPQDDAIDAIVALTEGEVDLYALHLKRQQWRKEQGLRTGVPQLPADESRPSG